MSYYVTKTVRLKKNGKISVTVADSSIRPLHFWTSEYKGTVAEFLKSVQDGNFRLGKSKANYAFNMVERAIREIINNTFDKEGFDFRQQLDYGLNDRERAVMVACEAYADRLIRNDWSDPKGFGEELGTALEQVLAEAKANYKAALKADKANGIMRIDCASLSIFEDEKGRRYDLLNPRGAKGFVLAPNEDYSNGKLKATTGDVLALGDDSSDMYAFLSFDGIGMSMDEYIDKCPGKETHIRNRFAAVDRVVKFALDNGLRLIAGKKPYIGYITV